MFPRSRVRHSTAEPLRLHKMDIMTEDLLVKLCTDFYSKNDIEAAKRLFFDLCRSVWVDINLPRQVRRQGPKTKNADLIDTIILCHEIAFFNCCAICKLTTSPSAMQLTTSCTRFEISPTASTRTSRTITPWAATSRSMRAWSHSRLGFKQFIPFKGRLGFK